jgi:hypothetical protein
MTTVTWIIVVLVLLALAAAAYVMMQNRRRAQLQQRLGPEYDRQVEAAGSRREAEQHLAGVVHKRNKLPIRDLDESERARYVAEWDVVQARFVDEPGAAVDAADQLITTVMRDRGYPVEDFDEQADMVAVDHPDVVSHYREAHAAHERYRAGGGLDTEDLRQSVVHYRALFVAMVHPGTPSSPAPSRHAPSTAAAGPSSAEAPVTDTPVQDTPGATRATLPTHHQETR